MEQLHKYSTIIYLATGQKYDKLVLEAKLFSYFTEVHDHYTLFVHTICCNHTNRYS
jgi:hypothetical protein